ncbi:anti-CBASS protein Acb1 family protein [Enterobacter hormaechei]|uniref:anti-CBASS protein Acb1 family protein n=1 Tax=Enterobacter hormaechei TaxID=158836 RepID=UPI002044D4C1|nr:anti-CBASS Acb1 family protein [Enterobacter hormaechei]
MTSKTSLIPVEGILTKEGVMPAQYNHDGYVSMMTSVAAGGLSQGAAGMGSPTANRMKARSAEGMIPLVAAMAAETSGIGWRIITEPVAAAMLNQFTVVTDNPDDAEKIKDLFGDMRVWQCVEKAVVLKRHMGWSVLVMGDEWVRSHGANWVTPSDDWFTDYNSPLFGLPEGWRIQLRSPIGGEVFIEQEDSILFGDPEYQPIYACAGIEFGAPLLSKPYASLQRLGLSHELIISILSLSVQDIYKKEELAEDLKTAKGEAQVARRIGGIAATRHLNDMIAVDKDESIERLQTVMTGTADLVDMAIKLVCAETGFPIAMLAERKGGLSNSDTSADAQWQNLVSHITTNDIIPALKKLALRYLGIRAEFVPNKSQGQIDREVDRDKKVAETAQLYYSMRAITSEEARATAQETGAIKLLSTIPPATGTIDDQNDDDSDRNQDKSNQGGTKEGQSEANNGKE